VRVYDDAAALRIAAERYCAQWGTADPGEFREAHGVTHTVQVCYFDDAGEIERVGEAAALIRLHREAVGTSVVTHEVAHAASAIYRQDCQPDRGPVHDCMDNEEVFCYLVGDLTRRVVDRLYHYGYYGESDGA
jgi:hypothetical protein